MDIAERIKPVNLWDMDMPVLPSMVPILSAKNIISIAIKKTRADMMISSKYLIIPACCCYKDLLQGCLLKQRDCQRKNRYVGKIFFVLFISGFDLRLFSE